MNIDQFKRMSDRKIITIIAIFFSLMFWIVYFYEYNTSFFLAVVVLLLIRLFFRLIGCNNYVSNDFLNNRIIVSLGLMLVAGLAYYLAGMTDIDGVRPVASILLFSSTGIFIASVMLYINDNVKRLKILYNIIFVILLIISLFVLTYIIVNINDLIETCILRDCGIEMLVLMITNIGLVILSWMLFSLYRQLLNFSVTLWNKFLSYPLAIIFLIITLLSSWPILIIINRKFWSFIFLILILIIFLNKFQIISDYMYKVLIIIVLAIYTFLLGIDNIIYIFVGMSLPAMLYLNNVFYNHYNQAFKPKDLNSFYDQARS